MRSLFSCIWILIFMLITCPSIQAQTVTTVAGDGTPGLVNDAGTVARFNLPRGITIDAIGNLYIADFSNHRIRKIDSTGNVTTVAGSGATGNNNGGFADGPGTSARFYEPSRIVADPSGNVFVLDPQNERIRKVTFSNGEATVTTIAGDGARGYVDGPGSSAQFNTSDGIIMDSDGNLYIADSHNHRIRKITFSNGDATVTTVAGSGPTGVGNGGYADGPIASARFDAPAGLAVDVDGNLYVVDTNNHRLRKITFSQNDTTVTTFAGNGSTGLVDGVGTAAQFHSPHGIVIDTQGNLFVTDSANHRIRKITPDGTVTTAAGSGAIGSTGNGDFADGPPAQARFHNPQGITIDTQGSLYIADQNNHRIRKVTFPTTPPAMSSSVTVVIDTAFGAPNDTVRVSATMTNPNPAIPVGGLQFTVILSDTIDAHFSGIEDTLSNPGLTVSTTTSGDSTRLVVFSGSGAAIQPGTDILLATLVYTIDPSATLGSTIPLTLTSVEIGDTSGVALPDSVINGELQVGIRGDVNLDGRISILDVIQTVRIIIGKDATPDTGSVAYNIADMNADGAINIIDVILQVNTILGIATKPLAVGPTTPVIVSLDAVQTLSDGQLVVPVMLEADGVVAGAQATFTFDQTQLQVGTPQIVGDATGLSIDSHVVDGSLRVVVYGMMPGSGIATGQDPVLHIPVTVREGVTGTPSLTLADILMVDPQAQRVQVTMGETIVTVTKDGAVVPTTFALDNARPNPFNPNTTISYEVPQQGHIRLTVYNLLGQEVVRLVDQVKVPGRYTAIWNGRNVTGHAVASGIYMYRLTSSTGFNETKRMTLLK